MIRRSLSSLKHSSKTNLVSRTNVRKRRREITQLLPPPPPQMRAQSSSSDSSSDRKKRKQKSRKFSSTSSSDDSPTKLRRQLKRLRKKGKLRSGRHRMGLAVIRHEDWPYDGINNKLAGKHFKTVESLTPMAFVAGILNPILEFS